jgi:RNA-directed DNA polymerase
MARFDALPLTSRPENDWVVNLDLRKFFDRVNHDVLMARVARRVEDKQVLGLIGRYLRAGMMRGGVMSPRSTGTPQGGPLSPLLSNILLDDLDKWLEGRNHLFVRYADDFLVFKRSDRAAERVKSAVTRYLEQKLRLQVNEEKSSIERPETLVYLGYTFVSTPSGYSLQASEKAVSRLRERLRPHLTRLVLPFTPNAATAFTSIAAREQLS